MPKCAPATVGTMTVCHESYHCKDDDENSWKENMPKNKNVFGYLYSSYSILYRPNLNLQPLVTHLTSSLHVPPIIVSFSRSERNSVMGVPGNPLAVV